MTAEEQISAFSDELDKLVHRYRHEFDMPLAAFVGVLEIRKHTMIKEVIDSVADDPDEDGEEDDDGAMGGVS